jgi:hypothetical protein
LSNIKLKNQEIEYKNTPDSNDSFRSVEDKNLQKDIEEVIDTKISRKLTAEFEFTSNYYV